MFMITMPLNYSIGETPDCKINGEPRKLTWRDKDTSSSNRVMPEKLPTHSPTADCEPSSVVMRVAVPTIPSLHPTVSDPKFEAARKEHRYPWNATDERGGTRSVILHFARHSDCRMAGRPPFVDRHVPIRQKSA
jgi:hypothetical protein